MASLSDGHRHPLAAVAGLKRGEDEDGRWNQTQARRWNLAAFGKHGVGLSDLPGADFKLKAYRCTLAVPVLLPGPADPSHKRENDDPRGYQGGHARDGDAKINTADEGVLRLHLDLTAAHCTSPCSYPVPHT